MNSDRVKEALNGLVDTLAAVEHERWSHWQRYMHSKGELQADGSLLLPANLIARWEMQIKTPFEKLTESEKESDREQVQKYLPLIIDALAARKADRD